MPSSKVGFIGLGRMGGGMARHLLKTTGELFAYDLNPVALEGVVAQGATACDSPAQVAKNCDFILLCLPFAPEVREVLFGASGIQSAAKPGLTVVDTSTLDRNDALAIAEEAATHDIAYWDCPISGMPFRADNGTLTVMFGGTDAAFQAAQPYLESFGETVIHCGALGSGQAMKAINNIIYNVNIAALCEVLPLTVAIGLKPEEVARTVTTASARSFASEYFVSRMLDRKFDTDFALQDAYKDIVNVQNMAAETGAHLPVVQAMIGSYDAAIEAGFGAEPKSAMLKVYEQALGAEYRRSEK
ncbi:MAG: NAD(P)-dependent oxidoreductase [Rhizobiales bacterium]|nr:NAD(P)-dependent oxidoreductase [Hyphomicrobiales bacterium]